MPTPSARAYGRDVDPARSWSSHVPDRRCHPGRAHLGQPVLTLTPKVRLYLYIGFGLGSILVAYLSAREVPWLGAHELAAWASLVDLVNGLAAFNVKTK